MSTIEQAKKKLGRDFLTHNDNVEWEFEGGSLMGYIHIDYESLVEKLGEPHGSDGYKSDAEWEIFDGETSAYIYNWKDGRNYNNGGGMDVEDITHWHIGGPSRSSVNFVKRIFPMARITRM